MPPQKTFQHLTDASAYQKLIKQYDVWLFDCDGVLWSGDDLIPGAKEVLEKLRGWGKEIVFVTNNASKSRKEILKKFVKLGVRADETEIFSSSYAAAVYLKKVLNFPSDRKVYVIGMEGIEEELDAEGIQHCGGTAKEDNVFLPPLDFSTLQDDKAIDPSVGAVMCGFDMHLSYIKLAKAYKHLTRPGADGPAKAGEVGGGCHFILTNDDSTFPARGGPWPGAGSLSSPLLFATKRQPTIIGKPHQHMLDTILAAKHFERSKAIFVGDRLDTDIDFANRGDIASLMVLTGISTRAEIEGDGAEIVPDYLVESLGDLDQVKEL
ncbi:2-phosphoglycolate phosphatase [Jaminaea rosea]|uniref:4-nitrophenylphosphatase n=1 Tax=Jaminaea rosea TaxID=1569628 RepID=A0A316UNU3_9BASI|nr:2-phosphoglycolate phosphatase [Jaminaea rosea]PWN26624.1 2-phosphoglycolate phosphatase [Jaminaea rosea]